MRYEIKEKIYNEPNLLKFLRENSSWYKYLNRRMPIDNFESQMKERYGLRFKDKVNKVSTASQLFKAFMDVTKDK